jgi:hypothetical protein
MGRAVTILADPGARLDRDGDGPILAVRGAGTDVEIFDLEIVGASGAVGANAIELAPGGGTPRLSLTRVTLAANQGNGVLATGGTLAMRRSTVTMNFAGGLSLAATEFDLQNNLIVRNGNASSAFGGLAITQSGAGLRRLEFNTIAGNSGAAGATTGLECSLVTSPITFSNNIVFGNQVGGTGAQVRGANCAWTYSDIGPETVPGTGNLSGDPMFVNPALNDFHLAPGSAARDRADPAATLEVDFDGDPRPAGPARDIGADELK